MTGWVMKEHGVLDSRLTVIEEDKNYKKEHNIINSNIYWKCLCQCGNIKTICGQSIRDGTSLSCGCLISKSNSKDIKGLKFNKLIAIEPTGKTRRQSKEWKCVCDCGNICFATVHDLQCGSTKSCGCLRLEQLKQVIVKDLKNQRFGKLIALEDLGAKKYNKCHIWKCLCDCGTYCEVDSSNLISGKTQSCGCLISKGELLIRNLLNNNSIIFETQKKYDDCLSKKGYKLSFDFYINNSFLLEYDGEQHQTGWRHDKESYNEIHYRDEIKNKYALLNNIPLKRIPYQSLNTLTIEDIMGDKYLVHSPNN